MTRQCAGLGKDLTIAGATWPEGEFVTTSAVVAAITLSSPGYGQSRPVASPMGRLAPTSDKPGTTLSDDNMPSFDTDVPCEWTVVDRAPGSNAQPCPNEAKWRVVSKSTECNCGKHIVLCCTPHEKQLRIEAVTGQLLCKAHQIPVEYVRSVSL